MPDFTDLIIKIRNSDLPEARKKELEHRLIREGPTMDVDKAIRDAMAAPYTFIESVTVDKPDENDREYGHVLSLCAMLIGLCIFLVYSVNPDLIHSLLPKSKPKPVEITYSKPKPKPLRTISVTARELYADFERNAIAAERKYSKAVVEVNGYIDDIRRNIQNIPYVHLSGGGAFGVRCFFDESDADTLARLSPGQNVTISGIVTGKFSSVQMAICKIE